MNGWTAHETGGRKEVKLWTTQRVFTPESLGLDRYDLLDLRWDPDLQAIVFRASIAGTKKDLELALWRFRYEIESMEREVRKSEVAAE